jgi:hypothetical protein
LAGELDDGMSLVITAGELVYRRRDTKEGERSRLEILVWRAHQLRMEEGEGDAKGEPAALHHEAARPPRKRPRSAATLSGGFSEH